MGELVRAWWAIKDLNLGPLACEASTLTAELIAHEPDLLPKFVAEAPGIFNQ
jgi:hypothetical protein